MERSEQELLKEAVGGNKRALVELLEEHTPTIYQQLADKISQRWQAVLSMDDVIQQTCADAVLSIRRFIPREGSSFGAWLFTIANRNLIHAIKMLETEKRGKGHRRIIPHMPHGHENSFVALYELLSAGTSTPSGHVARGEACGLLKEAILQLPATYRQAVQMYDIEGQSAAEVARALKRSPGAIQMIRTRAHHRLQKIMGNISKYFSTV